MHQLKHQNLQNVNENLLGHLEYVYLLFQTRTDKQNLFPIVQGGLDAEKRRECAKELIKRREIYQVMETATDKCEDAGNVIESIVVKYA